MRNKPGQTLRGFGSDENEESPFILTCSPFLRVMEVAMRLGYSAGLRVWSCEGEKSRKKLSKG